jgi:hypothetical protein
MGQLAHGPAGSPVSNAAAATHSSSSLLFLQAHSAISILWSQPNVRSLEVSLCLCPAAGKQKHTQLLLQIVTTTHSTSLASAHRIQRPSAKILRLRQIMD